MMSSSYTEDHLVEQPAIQLMEHELGWDSVNAYGEWASGTSTLGRDGKREVVLTGRLRAALLALNPDLPVEALVEANREIDKLRWPSGLVLFAPEPDRRCNRLGINEFLFELKTSVAVSPFGETQRLSEIPVCKLMKSLFSRNRENKKNVKIGLLFTGNRLFTTT